MAVDALQQEWVARVLGISVPAETTAKASAGLEAWQREREAAIGRLQQLEAAINQSSDTEGPQASILIKAIVKNLTARPAEIKAVDELQRWLETDDILDDAEAPNPFGIDLNVRAPLLGALGQLRTELTS